MQQARYGTTKGAFAMSIIGETTSELGGGKFANGAMGSAFQYLFNDMVYGFDPLTGDGSGVLDSFYESVQDGWDSLQGFLSNNSFTQGMNQMAYVANGTINIYGKVSNAIPQAYGNANPYAQKSLNVALTIVEYGVTKPLSITVGSMYDLYSGYNFNTIPTSSAGWVGNLSSTPLE